MTGCFANDNLVGTLNGTFERTYVKAKKILFRHFVLEQPFDYAQDKIHQNSRKSDAAYTRAGTRSPDFRACAQGAY